MGSRRIAETELRELLTEQHRTLRRRVRGWLPRHGRLVDAEDVVQQAYVRALGSVSMLRTSHASVLRAWLLRIARNLVIDDNRRAGRHGLLSVDDPAAMPTPSPDLTGRVEEPAAGEGERGHAAPMRDLMQLRRDERMALVLRDLQAVSWETSTTVLGRPSEKAARNLLLRGRARLVQRAPRPGQSFA